MMEVKLLISTPHNLNAPFKRPSSLLRGRFVLLPILLGGI